MQGLALTNSKLSLMVQLDLRETFWYGLHVLNFRNDDEPLFVFSPAADW